MSSVPPWILPVPEVNIELLEEKKDHPDQQSFAIVCKNYLSSSYHGYIQNGHCGIGIYIPEFNQTYGYRLSNFVSVYSVEMTGVITDLRWIEEVKPLKSVICTDSMSVLQSLLSGNSIREDRAVISGYRNETPVSTS